MSRLPLYSVCFRKFLSHLTGKATRNFPKREAGGGGAVAGGAEGGQFCEGF